jgi:hypothetical protein
MFQLTDKWQVNLYLLKRKDDDLLAKKCANFHKISLYGYMQQFLSNNQYFESVRNHKGLLNSPLSFLLHQIKWQTAFFCIR